MAKAQLAIFKIAGAFLFVLAASLAWAQDPPPEASDPSGYAPYKSFHGGEIDSVGLSNGQLMINYPFLSYPQRGDLHVSFTLQHNGKAHDRHLCDDEGNCIDKWAGDGGNMGFGFSEGASVGVKPVFWFRTTDGLS